jgi:uncharacterized protein
MQIAAQSTGERHDRQSSAITTVHSRNSRSESGDGRGRVEHARSGARRACLTSDSRWRNRAAFLQGREAIMAFLTRKWQRELDYRLIKEVWAIRENRIAVRFAYECHDDSGTWFRSFGNENWEFDEHGLMRLRIASINDLPIKENERKYHWPLGRRPAASGWR